MKTNHAAEPVRHANGRGQTRQNKPHSRLMRVVIILLVFLLIVSFAGYILWQAIIGRVNVLNPSDHTLPSEYDLPTESLVNPLPSLNGITNILLLGVDTRDPKSIKERSDSMMILTLDQNNKKIKLTSLQRDMLVYLPGKTNPVKINAANSMGGPALALRAVNDTFRLDIKDFAVINMFGMEKLVDVAGGVMIDVPEDEVTSINDIVDGTNAEYPDTPQSGHVSGPGLQLLNGRQAVAFARIRKQDSDYKRMARQRQVMQALLDAFRAAGLATKTRMVSEGLSLISTNMSTSEMTNLALKVVPILDGEIDQLQIPIKGYFIEDSTGTWVNRCDFNGMIPHLQEFIFGRTFPFDPVKKIPGAPNSDTPAPTEKPSPTQTPTATTTASASSSQETTPTPTTAATTTPETTAAGTTETTPAGTTAAETTATTAAATTAGTTTATTTSTTTTATTTTAATTAASIA